MSWSWGQQLACPDQGCYSSFRGPHPCRGLGVYCRCHLLSSFISVRVAVDAISVETTQDVLRAARGKSVTLPCTYSTSTSERSGFIQWDKLLRTETVRLQDEPGHHGSWLSSVISWQVRALKPSFCSSLPPSFLLSGLRFKSRTLCIISCTLPLSYGLHVLFQNIFYEDILYIYIYHWFVSYILWSQINTNIVIYIIW